MISNSVSAAPASKMRGDALACMDRLPAPLRRALHEAVVEWDPRETRWNLNKRVKAGLSEAEAIAAELDALRAADRREMNLFAHCWPRRFGVYPAKAANSTILRYDEASLHGR